LSAWPIYRGASEPHDGIANLPEPPNWRSFRHRGDLVASRKLGVPEHRREPDPHELQMINAALFLRRPLLVTGRPGTGKSTIAYAVAEELKLGPVLKWPITSRSTLREGLYHYDPIGRLREENLRRMEGHASSETDIGRYLRLGPLGTALLPRDRPRVLLIDEIDKSDIDLPNDLLNVFEDGEFEVDELVRLPDDTSPVSIMTADRGEQTHVERGLVRCDAFPFVVLTSNGEREFPPAFLRRCLRLDLQPPDADQLNSIVAAHLGADAVMAAKKHIEAFLAKRDRFEVTTDQLLNAVYLATSGSRSPEEASFDGVINAVLRPLTDLE
jgi:MoxR-like ATPase